jgi:hypothetical protein
MVANYLESIVDTTRNKQLATINGFSRNRFLFPSYWLSNTAHLLSTANNHGKKPIRNL